MIGLAEFLLARIGEDEESIDGAWADGTGLHIISVQMDDRMRAECAAKRRIIERHQCDLPTHAPNYRARPAILRDLAAVYADHKDYREEWRP